MEKEAAVNRASFSVGEKGVPMQLQKLLSLIDVYKRQLMQWRLTRNDWMRIADWK